MAKRAFRPEDGYRVKTAAEPELSPDGHRVAFTVREVDEERDKVQSSIWVAGTDGSAPPRRFTEGPADRSPTWSPDGHWLAYISVIDDKPHHAHVRLAPLDGGAPSRLGHLPGPVVQLTWSPDSGRLAVVCQVGGRDPDADGRDRNAPRTVRGLAARLDGIGWYEGRRHIFIVDVDSGATTQVTRGDYDHADPAFSPDGQYLVFVSDRHRRRDDREFRSDVWLMASGGGRPQRLSGGHGFTAAPQFSPDGSLVAFAGTVSDTWDEDGHVFVMPVGGGEGRRLAPRLDRPVPVTAFSVPFRWWGEREIVFMVADRGRVHLHAARVGDAASHEVVGLDTQLCGLGARPGRPEVAFTAVWPDRPSELYVTSRTAGSPTQLSELHAELLDEVELSPPIRSTITRPDGTEIDYFTLLPPKRRGAPPPLHLDVHGGPHGWWPTAWALAFQQSIAGAGYTVVLPNPRGSASYGQQFTAACTGDWGGADFEDILACCEDAVVRGVADGKRMFVHGYSYGGFMTAWAVGHTQLFRAATASAAVIDQRSMINTDVPHFLEFNMGGTPWGGTGTYEKRSPLTYLPDVNTPVLVLHWEGDLRVPIGQGEELYAGLRLLGKEAEFVRYPGGFHDVHAPSQDVDWARQVLAWNAKHDPRRAARSR